MKKILIGVLLFSILLSFFSCEEVPMTPQEKVEASQQEILQKATTSIPVPSINYFQEKRTIAKWAERWDVPNIPAYCYIFMYGTPIGYFITDGKPASTRSYITPEERLERLSTGNGYYENVVTSAPDIDGTWGDNNPGIRFFTAEGKAVEVGGYTVSYIYSDAPLNFNVPKLYIAK